MVENLDLSLINTPKAQEHLKELIEKAEATYVDCIYNIIFTQLQIRTLNEEDIEADGKTESEKESAKKVLDSNQAQLRANQGWQKQYEIAIPYLKTLLITNDNDTI